MENLDLLKRHWKTNVHTKTYCDNDTLDIIHRKSFSYSNRIFLISIAELVFWALVQISSEFINIQDLEIDPIAETIIKYVEYINYFILVVFIMLFYFYMRRIKNHSNIMDLMGDILSFRDIVKKYVLYNLFVVFIGINFYSAYLIYFDSKYSKVFESKFATMTDKILLNLLFFAFSIILLLCVWLFYRLIYGRLLDGLNTNYKYLKNSN